MNQKHNYQFWLVASILAAMLFSLSGFGLSWNEYTIQDDARQHVFWLQRLQDSELFPNDVIADYFSSVAPAGYKLLYWAAGLLGIKPFLLSKILPLLLGIITTIYLYSLTLTLFPVPLAGFLSSLLLNQNLWLLDDLVSGTPRAFIYPLMVGFLYHFRRQQLWLCLWLILLQGLFYPQTVLLTLGILTLSLLGRSQPKYFLGICISTGLVVLAIYKFQTKEFSDVISPAMARQLPEFWSGGRSEFFLDNSWQFWLTARRSGFFPFEWQYFTLCSFGLLLPLAQRLSSRRFSFKLLTQSPPQLWLIGKMLLASLGLFLLSHLLLFQLHLPGRYSQHTWRIAIALLAGISLTILLEQLLDQIARNPPGLRYGILAIATCLVLYPTYAAQSYEYRLGYVSGPTPELYQFLQQQPKNVVIATLSPEGDFIPSLAQRTVLTAREYSIPYHWDYYSQLRQRTQDLIKAQYSSDPQDLEKFITQYGVDLWLLERQAFSPEYLENNSWLSQFSAETEQALQTLHQGQIPQIINYVDICSIVQHPEFNLLDGQCLLNNNSK